MTDRSPTVGIIGFHQQKISCIVGIYPEERLKEQLLILDLKVKVDFSNCLYSDKLEDTIDYVQLATMCYELAIQNHYDLIEKFASDILEQCIRKFHALWAWVRIQKPAAIANASYAYVELERYQEGPLCGRL